MTFPLQYFSSKPQQSVLKRPPLNQNCFTAEVSRQERGYLQKLITRYFFLSFDFIQAYRGNQLWRITTLRRSYTRKRYHGYCATEYDKTRPPTI